MGGLLLTEDDVVEQLDKLLTSGRVSWLFGAGISRNAGVPLMWPLTERITELAKGTDHEKILDALKQELPDPSHIEHLLSYLADHIAVADRSVASTSNIGGSIHKKDALVAAHTAILSWIGNTVRWGYRSGEPAIIGSREAPIINLEEHLAFAQALFTTTFAGVADRRAPVKIFTTNYDTLLEDALGLSRISYWDGFDGGAVAFRSYSFGAPEPSTPFRAHIVKLHGSIDWHIDSESRVWRVREGDLYPSAERKVLIYPQATKYAATQRDPFASQFDIFRRQLSVGGGHVLVTCGYSFGDDHINDEIATAMSRAGNDAALVALVSEAQNIPPCLNDWRRSPWGKHLYVLTERGAYVGGDGPLVCPNEGDRDWWTFAKLSQILTDGVKEHIS